MKTRLLLLSGLIACIACLRAGAFAQDPACCDELSAKLAAAKGSQEVFGAFVNAQECFFRNNRYNEFCECLKAMPQKQDSAAGYAQYFTALTRYTQLKYLEEKQQWEEYFNKGNEYRNELTEGLQQALEASQDKDALKVYAALLLWQFHKDQEDSFVDDALAGVMAAVAAYAKDAVDIAPIKDAADTLRAYEMRGKSKELYTLYMHKVVSGNADAETLKNMAAGFLKDANLELAEAVYDSYIQKLGEDKEKLRPALIEAAKAFAYKDEGPKDPFYAEKIFGTFLETFGAESLDEPLVYLRGYNLEKAKEFEKAQQVYAEFLKRFPQSAHADKVTLKAGLLAEYALRDIAQARQYYQKLAEKEIASSYMIQSLYQLGLLAQWEEDLERAKGAYNKLLEKAKEDFKETVSFTQERLKEIADNALLEINLRTFLDMALRPEYSAFTMAKVELAASAYNPKEGQQVTIASTATPPESGCMQMILDYGWVGDLAGARPAADATDLKLVYADSGTKVIGVVVKTASGIVDRAVDFIDVQ